MMTSHRPSPIEAGKESIQFLHQEKVDKVKLGVEYGTHWNDGFEGFLSEECTPFDVGAELAVAVTFRYRIVDLEMVLANSKIERAAQVRELLNHSYCAQGVLEMVLEIHSYSHCVLGGQAKALGIHSNHYLSVELVMALVTRRNYIYCA
jgi:hypothetical protein